MSAPIKPPGGPGPSEAPSEVEGGKGPAGADRASGAFQDALERARPAAAGGAGAAPGASGPEALPDIAASLRAGRIDLGQAVEQLVQRALGSPAAQGLSPALRAELEAHLRRVLADDPALAALARDLSRSP